MVEKGYRSFFVLSGGVFVEADFFTIRKGDSFRVKEPNGSRVLAPDGGPTFVAEEDAREDGSIMVVGHV